MTNLVYLINCDVNEISKIDVFMVSPLIYQGEPKKKKCLTDSSVSHKLFLEAGNSKLSPFLPPIGSGGSGIGD